jgi:hypothetical protein
MKIKSYFITGLVLGFFGFCLQAQTEIPVVTENLVFEEQNGSVAVEAELFYKQTQTGTRKWHITGSGKLPNVAPDPDAVHIAGSSQSAYIEVLPDTRVTHGDKLVPGENFSNEPGKMAVVHYRVKINAPGRYYVWARCYSSGTEDNGVHVGFNGTWPEHGQRMQWCEGKNEWTWASKQRTEKVHCGEPKEIYLEFDKAAIYDIQFSMREDGFEMDKFILTTDIDYVPEGKGPDMKIAAGSLPETLR